MYTGYSYQGLAKGTGRGRGAVSTLTTESSYADVAKKTGCDQKVSSAGSGYVANWSGRSGSGYVANWSGRSGSGYVANYSGRSGSGYVASCTGGPPPPPAILNHYTANQSHGQLRSRGRGNDSSGVQACFGNAGSQFESSSWSAGSEDRHEKSSNGATNAVNKSQQQSDNLIDMDSSELEDLSRRPSAPPASSMCQDQYSVFGYNANEHSKISEKSASTSNSSSIPSRSSKPTRPSAPEAEPPRAALIYFQINEELANKAAARNFSVIFFTKEDGNHYVDIPLISKVDKWDWDGSSKVRIPLSPNNRKGFNQPLWPIIVKQLMELKGFCETNGETLFQSPVCLQDRMSNTLAQYCKYIRNQTNFEILHDSSVRKTLIDTIPVIVDFALKLPSLLKKPVPLLQKGERHTIYLTKQLCASFLANAFFCTIPEPRRSMPDFNFFRLFNIAFEDRKSGVKAEKLKCILNYFLEMGKRQVKDDSIISFERRSRTTTQYWGSSREKLLPVIEFNSDLKIEDAHGHLQVDFANKLVGGGVLNDGAVMEEIRFSICPELIVARLFTEALEDNEVLVVTGTEQFSEYRGYGASFKFAGSPKSQDVAEKKLDNLGRIRTQVVAMDALHFFSPDDAWWNQYRRDSIDRELYKCFVAFQRGPQMNTPIATGNWGCGAFNGDSQLKFLIQWMAASEVERQGILYCTGDAEQSRYFEEMQKLLVKKYATVGELYKDVVSYNDCKGKHSNLFDVLESKNKSFYERHFKM